MNIKEKLFNQCEDFINKRLQTVEKIISSNQVALQSETKSSAGDKHETGRAMLQLEIEKASQQIAGIVEMKNVLSKINVSKTSKIAHLGSVVYTNKSNYFLSISAGKLSVNTANYFAISISSPIGKVLLGKQEKEVIVFNGDKIRIESVV